jgi:thioesterase domain-containing protein
VTIEVACAQFRALSDQLYGTPAHHSQVRRAAVAQLRAHPDAYAPFVDSDWGAYLRDMARQGTWGDHLTLQVRPAQTTPEPAMTHAVCAPTDKPNSMHGAEEPESNP